MAEISATDFFSAQPLKSLQPALLLHGRMTKTKSDDPREVQFYEDLADRLEQAVEAVSVARNLTRGDIAQAIGVSQSRLSNWTTNQNRPDWFHVSKLCRRFRVPPEWLLLGDSSQAPASLAAYLEPVEAERSAEPPEPARPRRGTRKRAS